MPHVYLDERSRPPVYRFQYWDHTGRRRSGTGTASRRETEQMAQRRQAFEHEIKAGVRRKPCKSEQGMTWEAAANEYLAWGAAQGGHGGRPWAPLYAKKTKTQLVWWQRKLDIVMLAELAGCLPQAERILREACCEEKGKRFGRKLSGKTLSHRAGTLNAFLNWCQERAYLAETPLKGMGRFDTTPKTFRRALTAEEVRRILEACEATRHGKRRRLGYELALASGLRRSELRALKVKHLDTEQGGIMLEAAWTKNRQGGFQPLPSTLLERLKASVEGKDAETPLVFVACDSANALAADLKRAGIPQWGPGGKVDFHALRVAYITFVIESGADVKTAQTLARHSNAMLTMNVYAKARKERLVDVTEKLGDTIFPTDKAATNMAPKARSVS